MNHLHLYSVSHCISKFGQRVHWHTHKLEFIHINPVQWHLRVEQKNRLKQSVYMLMY